MRWAQLTDVGLAVVLVVAFGIGAATMDDAVSTTPDEVIDLDTSLLPIGSDRLGELKQEVAQPNPTAETEERREQQSDGTEKQAEREKMGAGDETANAQASDEGSKQGTTSVIDWWQWLLRHLLLLAMLLFAAVLALVTGILVGRHRDRIAAWVSSLLARLGLTGKEDDDRHAETTPPECPDEVTRAWYEMVCCLGLERERTKTPDECAKAAVDAGHDPTVVRAITDAFQRVRYGNHPVTEDLVAQARAAVERIHERQQQSQQET